MKHTKENKVVLKLKKILKSKKVLIGISIVIFLAILILFSIYKITNAEEYVNNKMTKLVTKYYEENIKENAIGTGRLIVTLQTLKDAGFNIRAVKGKRGVSKDLTKAFSYVIIENPEETDAAEIVYIIENHLNGE